LRLNKCLTIKDSRNKNCLTDKVDFIKSLKCNDSDDNQKWEIIPNDKLKFPWVSIRNNGTGRVLTNFNGEIIKTEKGCVPIDSSIQVFNFKVNLMGVSLINQATKKCMKLALSNDAYKGDVIQVECSETGNDLNWMINFSNELPSESSTTILRVIITGPETVAQAETKNVINFSPTPTERKYVIIPPPTETKYVISTAPVTSIETENNEQPLKNESCFYMVNNKNGQTVSFGGNDVEVVWSRKRGLDQTVCVDDGPNGTYFIHWKRDYDQVFDIFEGKNTDGTRLIKYPIHGGTNQQFRFVRNAQGHYQFLAVNSGKAFGIWGNGIAQSTPTNKPEQLWKLIPA
jgi:hypothetical protein